MTDSEVYEPVCAPWTGAPAAVSLRAVLATLGVGWPWGYGRAGRRRSGSSLSARNPNATVLAGGLQGSRRESAVCRQWSFRAAVRPCLAFEGRVLR
jgi:hypothetical protein